MPNIKIFWQNILTHLLESLSFRLTWSGFLLSKFASKSKLMQFTVGVHNLQSMQHSKILCMRRSVPKCNCEDRKYEYI